MPFQTYRGGLWIPNYHGFAGREVDTFSDTLSAAGHRIALVFQIPKQGTLDAVEFHRAPGGTLDAASVIRASFQPVDASGKPTGVHEQFVDVLGSALGANTWHQTAVMTNTGQPSGVRRPASKGALLAFVLEFQTFTGGDSVEISQAGGVNTVGTPGPNARPYHLFHDGVSWSDQGVLTENPILAALRYSDGTSAFIAGNVFAAVNAGQEDGGFVELSSDANPDEAGLKFRLPCDAVVGGFWANLKKGPAGGDPGAVPVNVVLYDPASVVLATVEVPVGLLYPSGTLGTIYSPLPDDIPLQKHMDYRLAVKALAPGPQVTWLRFTDVFQSVHLDTQQGGASFSYTQRTDGGAWSDNDLRRASMGLQLVGLSSGGGGGGGGGGFAAVGRGFRRGMVG